METVALCATTTEQAEAGEGRVCGSLCAWIQGDTLIGGGFMSGGYGVFLFVRAGKPGGSIVRGTTAAYVRATGIITRPSTAGRRASMIQTYGQPHAACATDLRSHVEL